MRSEEFELITADLKRRRIPAEIKKVVSAMLDKMAEKVVVLKLKGISDITDFMVLCHGNSTRQNSAISDEIQKKLREQFKLKPYGVEGEVEAEWILLDYIDFVVHIFSEETREKYSLEKLWMDAKRYNFYPN
ncbi:MAG: ribosome silencing factor [Candidatus Aminicenantes bacterium]|nr:ribosome silencing factor [Candidatus Aminicenantes bacterium]NIM77853.1 ribosome silencing factor [Candidatus Aminicenantes bacterium]NIN17165.1 ribosome silencing factor [Candidatus Aminicenantes bacterium]NIN41058.1 ribosome silencing factor [Candidatus Aminicenantes bacterium]NIN83863.1 ribosome silencing factor [Candidatus Aminicenantes bacterium]